MSVLVGAGRLMNLLGRALTLTASGSLSSNYPIAGLTDGKSDEPAQFAAAASGDKFTADLSLISASLAGFEAMTGWTLGATAAQSSVNPKTGTYHLRLPATDDYASFDYTVMAGEHLVFDGWCYPTTNAGVTQSGAVRIYNPRTQHYLQADLVTWGASVANAATVNTAGSYQQASFEFQMESVADCLATETVLRVILFAVDAGSTAIIDWDEVRVWPAWNFASIHGHNIDPGVALKIDGSADNSAWTTVATCTKQRLSFCASFAAQTYRYVRLLSVGTNSSPIYIGEAVLCYAATIATAPILGSVQVTHVEQQVEGPDGEVYSATDSEERIVRMNFQHLDEGEYSGIEAFRQMRDEWLLRARIKLYPFVLVWDSAVYQEVILARLAASSWDVTQASVPEFDVTIECVELALPTMTS